MRLIKITIICLILGTLLYAPTNNKVVPKDKEEGGGRAWVEGTRGWSEDGTNLWTADTLYNVGIGTTNPLYRLDVKGDLRITGGIHDGSSFGNPGQVLVTNGSNVYWADFGGSGNYIWNQISSMQDPGNFWISGTGKAGSDTLGGALNDYGSGVYGWSYRTSTNYSFGGHFSAGGSGTGIKYGVYGQASAPSGSSNNVYGTFGSSNHSGAGNGYGAYGYSYHSGTGSAYGGHFEASGSGSSNKYGVSGYAEGPYGSSNFACGVRGRSDHSGTGSAYGGWFYAGGTGTGYKYGVYGYALGPSGSSHPAYGTYVSSEHYGTGNAYGAYGSSNHSGTGSAYGGRFYAGGTGTGIKYGVYGYAVGPSGSDSSAYGAYGESNHSGGGNATGGYFKAYGSGTGPKCGVYGYASAPSGSSYSAFGVQGWAYHTGTGDVYGGYFGAEATAIAGTKYGVYAFTVAYGTQYAGYFNGNVVVTGSLSKGGGSFLIDHPLDPANKTLRHNFVESPENLCLYRGKVKLNSNGEAIVRMPDYFVALTKEDEATVNLTPVGRPFLTGYDWEPGYSSFIIYGEPDREVSYVVYADRDDPVIHKLAKPVEEDKGPGKICNRGELLYPEAYGYPEEMGRDYKIQKENEEIMRKQEMHKPEPHKPELPEEPTMKNDTNHSLIK